MTRTIITHAIAATVTAVIILLGASCDVARPPKVFECYFDRISGVFSVTERELANDSRLITAQKPNGRLVMFPRDRITLCEEVPR